VIRRHRHFLVETLLALAGLVILNWAWFPEDPGMTELNPTPYWAVILLMAARYGTGPGLVAAALTAGTYLGIRAVAGAPLLPGHFITGLLFHGVALVLGEIQMGYARRIEDLEIRFQRLREKHEALEAHYAVTSQAKAALEERIVAQPDTVQTLYEAASRLITLDLDRVYPAALELTARFLGATRSSVYLREENGILRLHRSHGWPEEEPAPPVLDPRREPVAAMALERRAVVSLRDLPEDTVLPPPPRRCLLCAPLFQDRDRLAGLLCVDEIPFVKLNPTALRLLEILADWVSRTLHQAQAYQGVRERMIEDETTGAYTQRYFQQRLAEEFERADRYGLILSLLLVKVEGYGGLASSARRDLLARLGSAFRTVLRNVDLLARYRTEDTFAVLLPMTTAEGVRIVRDRLRRVMASMEANHGVRLCMGTATYSPRMRRPEELQERAEKDLERHRP